MPVVTVKFYAHVKDLAGRREAKISVSTSLNEAIRDIEEYVDAELYQSINELFFLMVNGNCVALQEDMTLKDGDQLAFVPVMVGG